ncbi:uncharacterized protein LACBIDRAFT_297952 [Laccaria bicolor S238N-H82]|uniref:Predicted protein n=1 Tax=Laccaria bicolor (strain S238N-H82 / ATCC MYA-4686) TaxID=486041 RepID=B0DBX0_LACBS|nr:uncharacterized protein LACBIDRAFT_297952 [Laccaria bicolor S238N-H82]EDR07791.1 predicted protein [Laccaria bicolor S238N-H82]|eukprot:XP_001881580.1 predicted protein [Laccaria bicolor S238N-H82]
MTMDSILPHDHTAGLCECPNCHNMIPVSGPAVSGCAPGHLYIHCIGCNYHYTFPKRCQCVSHRSPALTISAGSSSQKHVVRHPSPTPLSAAVGRIPCPTRDCTKSVNVLCVNKSCKNCCIGKGGCKITSHRLDKMSKREKKKRALVDPFPHRSYSLRPPSPLIPLNHPPLTLSPQLNLNFDAEDFNWPSAVVTMERQRLEIEVEKAAEERREKELEDQEEMEYQAALAASMASPAYTPNPSPLPPPVALDSPVQHDSPLQQSVPPSDSSDHRSPPQQADLALSPTPSSWQPQGAATTINALSPKAASSRRLRTVMSVTTMRQEPARTTHLDARWMRAHEDRTKQPLPKRGQSQVDFDLSRKFRITFWDKADEEPTTFPVLHCPAWPKWVLAESPTILQQLCAPPLDFYDPKDCLWIHADLSYPHEVSKDGYLFYRRRGIHCKNFEEYIDRLSKKPPHHRTNMRGERESVREGKKVKLKQQAPPSVKGDDSEVEFVDSTTMVKQETAGPLNSKRRRSPSFPVPSPKRV